MILAARLVLSIVFAVAGFAKLADRAGSLEALRAFGVPAALARPAATLLPLAELATAVLLLLPNTAIAGAVLGAALLLAFIAGIARSMARGEAPDCHCFGQLHSAPAGPRTLVRNALLAGLAGAVVVFGRDHPGASAFGWLGRLDGTQLALVVTTSVLLLMIVALGRFTLALLKQNGRILQRLDALESGSAGASPEAAPAIGNENGGLPIGSRAPAFSLPDLHGRHVTLESLRATSQPLLIVFTDPDCGPCSALMPEIGEWQRTHGALTIAVVSRGTVAANQAKSEEHAIANVLLQDDREVALAYDCPATPTAVLVAADGTLASGAAPGADNIRALVRHAAQQRPAIVHVPARPPSLTFSDLGGELVDLTAVGDRERVLLFWNPTCGFCERMLPELRAWEEEGHDDIELIVVSTGDPQLNRDQALASTIVLDDGFDAGRALGGQGTPSAVVLGADGRIASPIATGAPAVLGLLRGAGARASASAA